MELGIIAQQRMQVSWIDFIILEENKQNLIIFLAKELVHEAKDLPPHQELVVAGGCKTSDIVISSARPLVTHLYSTQEEADTRIILHASDASEENFQRVFVYSRDTDVLLLLIRHETTPEVWMNACTKKKPRCIPIHTLQEGLAKLIIRNLMAYHAITGCDSTSQFCGYSKMTTWRAYKANPNLLNTFTDQSEDAMADAEKFIIKLYSQCSSCRNVSQSTQSREITAITGCSLPPPQEKYVSNVCMGTSKSGKT